MAHAGDESRQRVPAYRAGLASRWRDLPMVQVEGGRTLSDHNIQKEFLSPLLLMFDHGLIFAGQQLEDDHTLSEYDIQKNIPLHMVLGLRTCIQLFVKTLADETITLAVKALDLSGKGKASVQDEEGTSPVHQCLIYVRKQLKDDHTLSQYDVQKETPLHLVLPLHACMHNLENTLADKVIYIPSDSFLLSLRGGIQLYVKTMTGNNVIRLLSLRPHFLLSLRGGIHLYVKTLTGNNVIRPLSFRPQFKTRRVSPPFVKTLDLIGGKASVQEKEGAPPVCQCLISVCKQLKDDSTLSEEDAQKRPLFIWYSACVHVCRSL